MIQKLKKIFSLILPLTLGVFLVYYTFKDFNEQQIQEVKNYFLSANYGYIALSLLFMKISQASRAYRWNYNLNFLGYRPGFLMNFASISIGYLVNLSIPRLGEISRATVLKKYNKIPFNVSFGTIVSERIVDLFFLLFFILLTLVFQYDELIGFLSNYQAEMWKLLGLFVLLLIFFFVMLKLTQTKYNWLQKIKNKLHGFANSLVSLSKLPNKGAYLLHTLIIWAGFVLSFYFGTLALPETSELSFGSILSAFVVGSLVISFTNGGLGAFPFFIANILAIYGISKTAGVAFGWILWTSQTLLVVFLGVLSFIYLSFFKNKKPW